MVIKRFTGDLPAQLEKQKFIQQLVDIEDIPHDDIESMAEFTRHLLQMRNNIDEWYKNGDLTQDEIDGFKDEALAKWNNEFRNAYRGGCLDQEITKKALDIIDALRKETLPLASQNMPTGMSNGQFYHLSDIPEIGWHKDWRGKYKKMSTGTLYNNIGIDASSNSFCFAENEVSSINKSTSYLPYNLS